MKMINKLKKWSRSLLFHMVVLYVVMLAANLMTPRIVDDLSDAITEGSVWKGLLSQLRTSYSILTGRTVADALSGMFSSYPKIFFNICNAFIYVLLILLICLHGIGSRRLEESKTVVLLLLTEGVVFFTVPYFGQVALWTCGACNYLWTMAIMLTFLLPFRVYTEFCLTGGEGNALSDFLTQHEKMLCWLSVLGIIAGWTNENTAGGMILLEMLMIGVLLFDKKRVPFYLYSGLVFSVTGFLLLILAPGNYVRRTAGIASQGKAPLTHQLAEYTTGVTGIYLNRPGLGILAAALIVLSVAAAWLYRNKVRTFLSISYAVTSLLVVIAFCATGSKPVYFRGMFGASVFLIIAVMVPACTLLHNRLGYPAITAVMAVLSAFMALEIARAIPGNMYLYLQETRRQHYLAQQVAAGNLDPCIPLLDRQYETRWCAMTGLLDVSPGSGSWVEGAYCKYYHLESITGIENRERWFEIYRSGNPELMKLTDCEQYLQKMLSESDRHIFIIATGEKPSDLLRKCLPATAGERNIYIYQDSKWDIIPLEKLEEDYNIHLAGRDMSLYLDGDAGIRTGEDQISLMNNSGDSILTMSNDGTIEDFVIMNNESAKVLRQ